MISKVIIGKTFGGACRYICGDKSRSEVLKVEGVRSYDHKLMAKDFEAQHALRPSLGKAVFHGILSFYPGEKIENEKLVEIAKDYLEKMNIKNTQYIIAKHTDKNHLHLHIIANFINNNGDTIKDNWIGLKGKKISQQLTTKYGLKQATYKNVELTNVEALNEKEANRYMIYQVIWEQLKHCFSLDELKERLQKQNVEILYKYKGQTNELQGISFKIGNYKFKGSEIDRRFSIKNLQNRIGLNCHHLQKPSLLVKRERQQVVNKHQHSAHEKDLLKQLMKPEKMDDVIPQQLLSSKKSKKKKSRGWKL